MDAPAHMLLELMGMELDFIARDGCIDTPSVLAFVLVARIRACGEF